MAGKPRCDWAGTDPLYVRYHDREWGVPVADERRLFEFIVLEGAQAGLSWITILRKRERYREQLAGFDPEAVARFGARDAARLMADPGIVRNRLKVAATIANARAVLAARADPGGLPALLWSFTGGRPVANAWTRMSEVPAASDASRAMSRELLRRGFKFVGPTICYALMQAVGMVNDHLVGCFRHRQVARLARTLPPPLGRR